MSKKNLIMPHHKKWIYVTDKITSIIQAKKEHKISAYLVGSQVVQHKENSDFDSVIVIEGEEFSTQQMRNLRKAIDSYLKAQSTNTWYHYKLFSEHSCENLAQKDGFRLAGFKKNNFHYCGEDILNRLQPNLDEINFVDAVLIQATYQYFTKINNNGMLRVIRELERWIDFNNELKKTISYNYSYFNSDYFCERSHLMQTLWSFIESWPASTSDMLIQDYLKKYFATFTHESTNKHHAYGINAVKI